MSDKTWKKAERDVANALGGKRRPVTGIDRNDGDVFTSRLEVQVKHRLSAPPPQRLLDWLDGIRETAQARNRIGVVTWKRQNVGAVGGSLVVLTLDDFVKLIGREEPEA